MKILDQLQHLDRLIVDNTTPPATSKLRNYLATIIEQAEAERDLLDMVAKLKREHQVEILRIAKLYSEGKGILLPPSMTDADKQHTAEDG